MNDAAVPLNCCRQMSRQFMEWVTLQSKAKVRQRMLSAIDLAMSAKKFLLPQGGQILDDPDLRALSGVERLRLPYQCIALEYREPEGSIADKAIVFAREWETTIEITVALSHRADGCWYVGPSWSIPVEGGVEWLGKGGGVAFMLDRDDERLSSEAMWKPTQIVASLMNALACSNVRTEAIAPRKQPKKARGALPFDTYHVLTIGREDSTKPHLSIGSSASSRSPREHLRRGHIRRYESGLRIWVNAAVVNAGVGGKVAKDYRVEKS